MTTTTNRLSVLVVSPPAEVWGAQLYLLDQVEALAARGVDLVLGTPVSSPFGCAWNDRGFPMIDLDLRLHQGLSKPGSTQRSGLLSRARSAVGVAKGVARIRGVAADYDVLHSFAIRSHLEVAAAGRLARTPVVLDLVNIVRPGIGRRVLQVAANLASLTVANSLATGAALKTETSVAVIHPGVDLERFCKAPRDEALRTELAGGQDRPLVAIIGRVDVQKGIQTLVEAMARAGGVGANARLIVVGEAGTGPVEFATRLEAEATEKLGDRVLFAGRRSDIPEVLRAVDVLVNASDAEPFGLTVLEAQAVGTPVVVTNAGGVVEFVEDEVTGLVVEPGDASAMAQAVERALGDNELVQHMTAKAYGNANPDRGLEAQYDEIAAMYRSVATHRAVAMYRAVGIYRAVGTGSSITDSAEGLERL